MNKSKLLKGLEFIIFLGLGVLLMYLAFRKVNISHLLHGLRNANYVWLAVSLAFGILAFVFRALRWRLLIEPLGFKPSLGNSFHAVTIGYLANFALPRAGEVTRCGILRKTEKVPFEKLVGTVIVERAFDLICLIILLTTVFFIKVNFFGRFIYDISLKPLKERLSISDGSFLPILIVLSILSLAVAAIYIFRHRLFGSSFSKKVFLFLKGIWSGLKAGFKMNHRGLFLLYTLLIWFSYLVMTWSVFYTIEDTSSLGIVDALFILAISSIGMAMPVQGGFGAFHLIVAAGLTLYGISHEGGLLYATISHESQTIMTIIVGLISLSYIMLRKQNYSSNTVDYEQAKSYSK